MPRADPPRTRTRPRVASTLWYRIPQVVGLVALLLLVDLAAGYAWRTSRGDADATLELQRPLGARYSLADPLWRAPAIADAPWRDAYAAEIAGLGYRYTSFLLWDLLDHRGEHVRVTDGIRRSWQAPGARAERPIVALYGGGLAFGIGQRDEHTVASELARLASEAGTPITVRNAGRPGWTSWQAMLWFERELAAGRTPDIGLFLGGAEDLDAQPSPEGRLSVPNEAEVRAAAATTDAGSRRAVVAAAHRRFSLARQVLRAIGPGPRVPSGTVVPEQPAVARDDARAAGAAQRRALAVAERLGADDGVVVRAAWQPQLGGASAGAGGALATAWPGTIDLTDLLADERGRFLDTGNLDEAGARRVAAALWREIEDDVAAWHAGAGGG